MLVDPDVTRTGTSLNNVEPFKLLCNARFTFDELSTVEDVVAVAQPSPFFLNFNEFLDVESRSMKQGRMALRLLTFSSGAFDELLFATILAGMV